MRSLRQWTHSRHCGEKSVTTWSPGATDVTSGPTRLDDAGALVPEHGRRVAGRVGARRRVEVGVADAAGDEADEHLARARLGELDLLHDERLAELLEYRGADLHARKPRIQVLRRVAVNRRAETPPRSRGRRRLTAGAGYES